MEARKARLARAYVPFQVLTTMFDFAEGLAKGTIFPELYFPCVPSEKGGW
ncbi:MAG: spore coat associated protein CotJA [Chitinophagales bacterium]